MLDGGRWIAECPGRPIVGFHINALYSPWKDKWASLAQEWIEAQDNPEALRAFINLQLGETFEESGDTVNPSALMERREPMPFPVPEKAVVLTCAADIQGNRIEAIIKAWGPGEESWLVDRKIFWGDPGADSEPWDQLDEFRLSEYLRADNVVMRPQITLVDSGDGNKVDAVYDWVLPRQRERVYACKGRDMLSRPVLVEESVIKKSNIRIYSVATHAAKDRIFSRIKIAAVGPGFMHFPDWVDEEYFAQLTGEKKLQLRDKKTRTKKTVWIKTHTRNEALDLEVYAMAGLFALQTYIAPGTFRDLDALSKIVRGETATPQRGRRVLSSLSR
jgi:phage terminase large subunit GpA-like protein